MPGRSLIRRAYDASYGRLFAASYDRMLARAERGELGARRAQVVGDASGRTLELGAGTGLNLPHYSDAVTELVLTEPFGPMAEKLRAKLAGSGREADVIEAPAENLPFDSDSFDTVVCTLMLCTVEDQAASLAEVARVLRPGGRLLFFEHVRAETPGLARAQDVLHGPWFAIGHGCHCNRDTVAAIERSELVLEDVQRAEMEGMAPIVKPTVAGAARLT
ncbi:MAG: class I SAM-dependent methyltransferase [Solirubrobacterales bacterium]|nr:MAG: class I SAM-dependent methyltransferase [Solirubrobacterales bacterium]